MSHDSPSIDRQSIPLANGADDQFKRQQKEIADWQKKIDKRFPDQHRLGSTFMRPSTGPDILAKYQRVESLYQ